MHETVDDPNNNTLVSDYVSELARIYIAAERDADPRYLDGVKWGDALAVARDGVIAVMNGEVAIGYATPGQKAIWHGRPRSPRWSNLPLYEDHHGNLHETAEDAAASTTTWRNAQRLERTRRGRLRVESSLGNIEDVDLDEIEEAHRRRRPPTIWQWYALYDTIEFAGEVSRRGFTSTHIGNCRLTNQQVPGSLPGANHPFLLEHLYVIPLGLANGILTWNDVPWDAPVSFIVGGRIFFGPMPLSQAYLGVNAPAKIRSRQDISVLVDLPGGPCPGLRLRVTIEGLRCNDM